MLPVLLSKKICSFATLPLSRQNFAPLRFCHFSGEILLLCNVSIFPGKFCSFAMLPFFLKNLFLCDLAIFRKNFAPLRFCHFSGKSVCSFAILPFSGKILRLCNFTVLGVQIRGKCCPFFWILRDLLPLARKKGGNPVQFQGELYCFNCDFLVTSRGKCCPFFSGNNYLLLCNFAFVSKEGASAAHSSPKKFGDSSFASGYAGDTLPVLLKQYWGCNAISKVGENKTEENAARFWPKSLAGLSGSRFPNAS